MFVFCNIIINRRSHIVFSLNIQMFLIYLSRHILNYIAMKKERSLKSLKGTVSLTIDPTDKVALKLLMLFEAATKEGVKVEDIAKDFGYTREHFYAIKKAFDTQGSKGLADMPPGPKVNYRRTKEIDKQIIMHRFLDPEASSGVIAQKMQQSGHKISQRSIERTINEYGLQKKGYIKQLR